MMTEAGRADQLQRQIMLIRGKDTRWTADDEADLRWFQAELDKEIRKREAA